MNSAVMSQVIEAVAWMFCCGALATIAVYLFCEAVMFLVDWEMND
jgi:hypothetical protein